MLTVAINVVLLLFYIILRFRLYPHIQSFTVQFYIYTKSRHIHVYFELVMSNWFNLLLYKTMNPLQNYNFSFLFSNFYFPPVSLILLKKVFFHSFASWVLLWLLNLCTMYITIISILNNSSKQLTPILYCKIYTIVLWKNQKEIFWNTITTA